MRITTRRQRGSALVTGLVFLVVIIMLGLSASSGSIQQELGVRSIRDQNIALDAADAALRAGETWLRNNGGPLPIEIDPVSGSAVVKLGGYCDPDRCADRSAAFWNTQGQLWYGVEAAAGRTSDLKLVAEQPRFIIEQIKPCPTCSGLNPGAKNAQRFYRITARGVGMNEKTYRIVQSIYRY